jgi:hypothetical protein
VNGHDISANVDFTRRSDRRRLRRKPNCGRSGTEDGDLRRSRGDARKCTSRCARRPRSLPRRPATKDSPCESAGLRLRSTRDPSSSLCLEWSEDFAKQSPHTAAHQGFAPESADLRLRSAARKICCRPLTTNDYSLLIFMVIWNEKSFCFS